MQTEPAKRIFGFDLLRSAAILIVVISHGSFLINSYFDGFPGLNPPDGVDLFFVLSGYLVGTIIISKFERAQKIDVRGVFDFLKRRWLRTLPNYYLFLVLNIILIYFGLINGSLNKYLVTFFVFFQNFHKPYDFLFWVSWSITIEEWFYLLFPVILLILFQLNIFRNKLKSIFLFAITGFIILPLVYRIIHSDPGLDTDLFFRKLVLTRLDTIGFGLLGAYIHFYHGGLWTKFKNSLFILGLAILFLLHNISINNLFFDQTFYFSLVGISILILLPKLESIKTETIPFKPFEFISRISYSMYFVHAILLQLIARFMWARTALPSFSIYVGFWITTIIFSWIIYRIYEKPLMDLRDKR
jgi:peptidoglycan/LPS O-acetylase OafA/YrhL